MTTITISSKDFDNLIDTQLVTTVELKTVSGGGSTIGVKSNVFVEVKLPRMIQIKGVTFVENI